MARVIVRHCKPEDNPFKTNNIRLGTLFGYRRTEDEARRDVGEGTFEFKVLFPKSMEVDEHWFRSIFAPSTRMSDPYVLRTRGDLVNIQDAAVPHRSIVSGSFTTDVDFFNCYILCTSIYESENEVSQLFDDAPDHWFIPEERADEFREFLVQEVEKELSFELIENPDFWPIRMVDRNAKLELLSRVDLVTYRDRDIVVRKQSDLNSNTLLSLYSNCPLIKPPKYSHEKEVRFVFVLLADGRPVPVRDRPLFINLSHIPSFVRAKGSLGV